MGVYLSYGLTMTSNPKKVIVIMAGGSGTRLWPLSRKNDPKQFQTLVSERTLLEETYDRALTVVSADCIYISTGEQYQKKVQELLPNLLKENILIEPESKNTAPAITLATAIIASRFPEAHIATIASDHVIYNEGEFTSVFTTAFEALEEYPDAMITVGINPTRPDTNFGYIQMGDEKSTIQNHKVFSVANFKEKPDADMAKKYLADWSYLWNAGYFIFSAQSFLGWSEIYTPEIVEGVEGILASADAKEHARLYSALPALAVEPAIIEKLSSEKCLVIPSALEWSDVGNWATLLEELQKITGENVIIGNEHTDIGSSNILVKQSEAANKPRFIGTIGLTDTIIIDTGDALLVAHKDSVVTDIKELLEKIKKEHADLL